MSEKEWAVVLYSPPFGVYISSQHSMRFMAALRARGMERYGVRVMRTAEAKAADREIVEEAARRYGFGAEDMFKTNS